MKELELRELLGVLYDYLRGLKSEEVWLSVNKLMRRSRKRGLKIEVDGRESLVYELGRILEEYADGVRRYSDNVQYRFYRENQLVQLAKSVDKEEFIQFILESKRRYKRGRAQPRPNAWQQSGTPNIAPS
jgi:hypothetical protein